MSRKITCMLIDDDREDHEIFMLALQNLNITVDCVMECVPENALQQLSDPSFATDFIFVDMHMPRINGNEIIALLRQLPHLAATKIIAYTSSVEHTSAFLDSGAAHVLPKAPTIPVLENSLSRFLAVN